MTELILQIQHIRSNTHTGPRFNIKMSSYQYRKSHCGDKTVVRSSYLHNGISYTGKMSSLYWIRALFVICFVMLWLLSDWFYWYPSLAISYLPMFARVAVLAQGPVEQPWQTWVNRAHESTENSSCNYSKIKYNKTCACFIWHVISYGNGIRRVNIHVDVIKWNISALLAFCVGKSSVPGEPPAQRPVTRSFDVFFVLCLNKRLSKQSWGWWFETPLCSLWRHCNVKCHFLQHDR